MIAVDHVSAMSSFRVREATEADCEDIAQMIKCRDTDAPGGQDNKTSALCEMGHFRNITISDTAKLHRCQHEVTINANVLRRDGFGGRPLFRCFLAEPTSQDDRAMHRFTGFMIFYFGYCSWTGKMMFLEDIYVVPGRRHTGVGGTLFNKAIKIAKDNDCATMNFDVAQWNKSALRLAYKQAGVCNKTTEKGWQHFSMDRDAIRNYIPVPVPQFSKL